MLVKRACSRSTLFTVYSPCRLLATDAKAYSKTLLLPRTSFTLWSNPKDTELPYSKKTSEDLYAWQAKNRTGPLFVLHDGPPYANGSLHMGHALNKIVKDIINRFQVLRGRRVNYIPGWDCHGLPIEMKTLKEMKKDPRLLPPHAIRKAAKAVANREIRVQREEFQELGIMADWSEEGTYRTLDMSYEMQQLHVFQKMVDKGLIYRSHRPVHYSPSSRSALAEAELQYRDDHVSRSVYVYFRLATLPKIAGLECEGWKDGNVDVMVWTTTPWTLTANMAIAVNPELQYTGLLMPNHRIVLVASERIADLRSILGDAFFDNAKPILTLKGADLVGLEYHTIFPSAASYTIIPASFVSADSGTGLVHCAPAHGTEDYIALQGLRLISNDKTRPGLLCHVDGEGRFSSDVSEVIGDDLGKKLVGLAVLDKGTDSIIEILQNMNGVLVKEQKVTHRYPYDWKTDKPIIVTATSQWFANLDAIKEDALNALKHVNFYPPESRNRLESFIRSRSEWCISRQRVWGVPIPSLHHIPSGTDILTSSSLTHILHVFEQKGTEHWWDGSVSDFVSPELAAELGTAKEQVEIEWRKGTDTMDVWFDSGSSWAMLRERGVESETIMGSDSPKTYADICVEGSDQHRGWFQSMLLTAIATSGDLRENESDVSIPPVLPYRSLITHGMVLDQSGRKMSKSIGNVMSPMTIVKGGKDKKKDPAYGADVLRFWAASIDFWRDAPIGPAVLAQTSDSLRKIRNTARFILGNVDFGDSSRPKLESLKVEDMSIADRYVMSELIRLEDSVAAYYEQFNFPRVVQSISRFANNTLSALYYDITKDVLYANKLDSVERRAVAVVLEEVLRRLTLMIAPITPHMAEELYFHMQGAVGERSEGTSVFSEVWVPLSNGEDSSRWIDKTVETDMVYLLKVREALNGLLEQARGDKNLRSSLEAEVDIILPNSNSPESDSQDDVLGVVRKHDEFLKTLFIVSDVTILDEGSLGTDSDTWVYASSIELSDKTTIGIRIRPSSRSKCPRCWTYTRELNADLCDRCSDALRTY